MFTLNNVCVLGDKYFYFGPGGELMDHILDNGFVRLLKEYRTTQNFSFIPEYMIGDWLNSDLIDAEQEGTLLESVDVEHLETIDHDSKYKHLLERDLILEECDYFCELNPDIAEKLWPQTMGGAPRIK